MVVIEGGHCFWEKEWRQVVGEICVRIEGWVDRRKELVQAMEEENGVSEEVGEGEGEGGAVEGDRDE